MPVVDFFIHTYPVRTLAYALGDYHPYRVRGEKNPHFDTHSGHILSLKDSSNYAHAKAVTYFGSAVTNFLSQLQGVDDAEIITMPPHKAGESSAGLERVVANICKRSDRFSSKSGTLSRSRTIDKLSKGGDRSVNVHLGSLKYVARPGVPRHKILIDDVTTTGNSLIGAVQIIRTLDPGCPIFCLVLGKTVHD